MLEPTMLTRPTRSKINRPLNKEVRRHQDRVTLLVPVKLLRLRPKRDVSILYNAHGMC